MEINRLRAVVVASSVVFAALAVRLCFVYAELGEFFQPALVVLLGIEVAGLWLAKPWALSAARWCWGALLFLTVFGCLVNPLFWHEFPSNSEPFGLALPAFYFIVSVVGIACWRVLRVHAAART